MSTLPPPSTACKKSVRQSNMELFRIVAMFLVLVVHADFYSLSMPTPEQTHDSVLPSVVMFLIESLSIVCVNCFVLLSGWFGIRPNLKSFSGFIFQCAFFLFGIYAICLIGGWAPLNLKGLATLFLLVDPYDWFIKAYIGLYILSPVLNAFVEHASEKQLKYTLVSFFAFQSVYGWIGSKTAFFLDGYSTISFIGLYLLARYVKLYSPRFSKIGKWFDLSIFILTALFGAVVAYSLQYLDLPAAGRMYLYTSPLVIVGSLSLLLFFSKIKLQNRFVNWVGASSFAAYLLHANPNIGDPFFKAWIIRTYESTEGVSCLVTIFVFLVFVFVAAILIDQLRLLLWRALLPLIENKIIKSRL